MDNPISSLQFINSKEITLPRIKNVVFFGDPGCTGFNEYSQNIVAKILKIKTDLFVILGDIVYRGTKEELSHAVDFYKKGTKTPVFTICGNHDMPCYSEFFGLSTYSIISNNFIILVLDNSIKSFSKEDLEFLDAELKKNKNKNALILFHRPPPTDLEPVGIKQAEWNDLKSVLDKYKDRIAAIFSGHIHALQEYSLDGYRIFITGGGGAILKDLEKSQLKAHHAIKLSLKNDNSFVFETITIE